MEFEFLHLFIELLSGEAGEARCFADIAMSGGEEVGKVASLKFLPCAAEILVGSRRLRVACSFSVGQDISGEFLFGD